MTLKHSYLVPYSVKAVIKNKKMKKVLNIKMNRYLQGTYLRSTALTLSAIFFSFFLLITIAHSEMLSVKGEKVNLRSGPGKNFPVLYEYGKGFPLMVVTKKGDWVKVKDFEKDSGWIHKSLLIKKRQMVVKVASRGKINIRSGPGTKYKKIGEAYYGVIFDSLLTKSGWVKVRHETGLTGWVKRDLLWGY